MNAVLFSTMIILFVFLITQVYKNTNLEKRIKVLEGEYNPPNNVIVGTIPDQVKLVDVDPKYTIIYDIIESVKLEEWKVEIEEDHRLHGHNAYMLEFKNPSKTIELKARFYLDNDDKKDLYRTSIGYFLVRTSDSHLSFDKEGNKGTKIENDICLFLWEHILKYHNDLNENLRRDYERSIADIKSKLTTLNRERKLKSII